MKWDTFFIILIFLASPFVVLAVFILPPGWIFTHAIIIFFSYWITSFVLKSRIVRALLVIPISTVLGLLPSAPELYRVAGYEPHTEYKIIRSLDIDENVILSTKMVDASKEAPVFPFPLLQRIKHGWDEGCGCSYLKEAAHNKYKSRVKFRIFHYDGKTSLEAYKSRSASLSDMHYELNTKQDPNNKDNYILIIKIFDHDEMISIFKHKNIPSYIVGGSEFPYSLSRSASTGKPNPLAEPDVSSATKRLINLRIISRENIWHGFFSPHLPSYFPEKQLDEFLGKALNVQQVQ